MQNDLIPQALQLPCEQFLQMLKQLATLSPSQCPYCTNKHFSQTRAKPLTFRCKGCLKYFNPLTATPFNRLSPAHWPAMIFVGRLERVTYQHLAEQLDCHIKMVIRRDKAVMQMMQTHSPSLYTWYLSHNDVNRQYPPNPLPQALLSEQLALKHKLTTLLTTTHANCYYCQSPHTVKVGQRTAFRCNGCRRGFNLLQGTPISHLRDADKWLPFIDRLVAKNSNLTIAAQLSLNSGTVGQWRRRWCFTMRQWGFTGLAAWCKR